MLIWLGKALLAQTDRVAEPVPEPTTVQFIVHPPTEPIPPDEQSGA
jgi:hypothetical protein